MASLPRLAETNRTEEKTAARVSTSNSIEIVVKMGNELLGMIFLDGSDPLLCVCMNN